MPTIRERIIDFALGDEKRKLQEAVKQVYTAYLDGPFTLPPEELARQLRETDSGVLNDLVTQLLYDNLGSLAGYQSGTSAERQRAVDESRRLWRYSPLAQWSVQTWTNFGLGESVQIVCADPDADEVWQECWTADRNSNIFADDCLLDLSNNVVVDGNLFLAAFASTQDGQVTWSEIPPEEIAEIVTHPDNANQPLFYKRVFTVGTESRVWYYPDWQAFFSDNVEDLLNKAKLPANAIRADKIAQTDSRTTTVCLLHIAHNRKQRGSPLGWPLLGIAAPYLRSHKQFMDSRLTVAAAKAMYVRRKKITGGSRALASVKAKLNSTLTATNALETNPPAIAGSTELDNSMIETSDLPMTTGAADADTDWKMFSHQTLIGMGLFPTTAGMDTSRWATALAMDKTQAMQWARYQTFWKAQFGKMVRVTLNYAEKYGARSFDNKTVQVTVDTMSIVDFPGVAESIAQMMNSGLTPLVTANVLTIDAGKQIAQSLWRVALKALGVDDEDVTSDATFGIAPNEIPQEVARVLRQVGEKVKRGEMTADGAAQFLIAELIENGQ